jgi:hypothetical protein
MGGAEENQERNLLYVIEAETFVSKTIRPFSSDTVDEYWLVISLSLSRRRILINMSGHTTVLPPRTFSGNSQRQQRGVSC